MEAGNLNCPMCGASASSDSPKCLHCGTRLATVSCPSCFAMMFRGSKFCPHCGARGDRAVAADTKLPCPRCKTRKLSAVALGQTPVTECASCHGLWVDAATFDTICVDREKQSIVLGSASEAFVPGRQPLETKIQYLRCPSCQQLMHRVNFAKCSGIIVDVCKGHGTWFDKHELQHIVQFIRGGGLDTAREKEKAELESARRRLEATRAMGRADRNLDYNPGVYGFGADDLADIAGSLIELVTHHH